MGARAREGPLLWTIEADYLLTPQELAAYKEELRQLEAEDRARLNGLHAESHLPPGANAASLLLAKFSPLPFFALFRGFISVESRIPHAVNYTAQGVELEGY